MLSETLESIRNYTRRHPELRAAHHFLFDARAGPDADRAEVVVVGINPGETEADWATCNGPTEESSEFDFHDRFGRAPASRRWREKMQRLCGNKPVAQTEFFFWSSSDAEADFRKRFGTTLRGSPHLDFCTMQNQRLLAFHRPRVVVVAGLGLEHLAKRLYNLKHDRTVHREDGRRVVEHYTDGVRPWLVAKHWSGARPSREDLALLRAEIAALLRH